MVNVFEKNAHVITASVKYAVNIHITAYGAVEYHVISAYKKTVISSRVYNGEQRRSHLRKVAQTVYRVHYLTDHALGSGAVLQISADPGTSPGDPETVGSGRTAAQDSLCGDQKKQTYRLYRTWLQYGR